MVQTMYLTTLLAGLLGPGTYIGYYENRSKDVQMFLDGERYSLNVGHPLDKAYDRRHVDFESGTVHLSNDKIFMDRTFLFRSPSRSTYQDLLVGGMHKGYLTEFKTEIAQKRFLSELTWREDRTPAKNSARLFRLNDKWAIEIGGVTLKSIPRPK